jgi:hypothetical protein
MLSHIACTLLDILTSCSRVPLEKQTVAKLIKTFPVFYGTRLFITMFRRSLALLLSQMSPVHILPPYFSKIHLNNILPYTPRSSERSLHFYLLIYLFITCLMSIHLFIFLCMCLHICFFICVVIYVVIGIFIPLLLLVYSFNFCLFVNYLLNIKYLGINLLSMYVVQLTAHLVASFQVYLCFENHFTSHHVCP